MERQADLLKMETQRRNETHYARSVHLTILAITPRQEQGFLVSLHRGFKGPPSTSSCALTHARTSPHHPPHPRPTMSLPERVEVSRNHQSALNGSESDRPADRDCAADLELSSNGRHYIIPKVSDILTSLTFVKSKEFPHSHPKRATHVLVTRPSVEYILAANSPTTSRPTPAHPRKLRRPPCTRAGGRLPNLHVRRA